MIDIKPGVGVLMTPENDTIKRAVDEALHPFGLHAIITAGFDGPHRLESKHFHNAALDFRIVWSLAQETSVLQNVTAKLPAGFRWRRETDHLHVERISIPDNLGG